MLKHLVRISGEHESFNGNAYVIDTRIYERHIPITSDLKFYASMVFPKSGSLENKCVTAKKEHFLLLYELKLKVSNIGLNPLCDQKQWVLAVRVTARYIYITQIL